MGRPALCGAARSWQLGLLGARRQCVEAACGEARLNQFNALAGGPLDAQDSHWPLGSSAGPSGAHKAGSQCPVLLEARYFVLFYFIIFPPSSRADQPPTLRVHAGRHFRLGSRPSLPATNPRRLRQDKLGKTGHQRPRLAPFCEPRRLATAPYWSCIGAAIHCNLRQSSGGSSCKPTSKLNPLHGGLRAQTPLLLGPNFKPNRPSTSRPLGPIFAPAKSHLAARPNKLPRPCSIIVR